MKIKTLWIVLAAVVVLLLIFGGCTVGKYNTIVADSNGVENAWGKVQTAYQRRADLVPNLVSTVKGAAAHEANTLQAVTDARAKVETVNITADQLTTLKLGQQVRVFADQGSSGRKEYAGTLIWISDKAEFTPKTIQTRDERANLVYAVKIAVENDGLIKLGMYGDIKF